MLVGWKLEDSGAAMVAMAPPYYARIIQQIKAIVKMINSHCDHGDIWNKIVTH